MAQPRSRGWPSGAKTGLSGAAFQKYCHAPHFRAMLFLPVETAKAGATLIVSTTARCPLPQRAAMLS